MPIQSTDFVPFRQADLAYIRNACQACAETIHAQTGLPAGALSGAGWCFLIDQSTSTHRWYPDPQKTERCHLVNLLEHDPVLGVYSLSTRALGTHIPASQYVAVCSRPYLRAAAGYLWGHCLGAAMAEHYYGIDKHLQETASALGLEEQPANHEPPCYSLIRSTAMLRFDPVSAPHFSRYFLLEDTVSPEPRSIELGGGSALTYRVGENQLEPVRAILGDDNPWNIERAVKELRRAARNDQERRPARA